MKTIEDKSVKKKDKSIKLFSWEYHLGIEVISSPAL